MINKLIEKYTEENYVYTYTQKIISQVVSDNDKETIKAIKRYCEENNIFPNLISEEKVKEILQLGIACKPKIDCLQSQLDIANKKLNKLDNEIKTVIEIVRQQPSDDDEWILGRLKSFLSIIGGNDDK